MTLTNSISNVPAVRPTSSVDRTTGELETSDTKTEIKIKTDTNETYVMENVNPNEERFNLTLIPLNSTVPSMIYKNTHSNSSIRELIHDQDENSTELNISLPDDGEIVLSHTGMWTTPNKLSATKVIRLGYLTGSQIRETKENKEFYNTGFYRRPGQVISGALTLAVVEINNNPILLPEHRVEFLPQETYGEESESILQTTLLLDKNISAYIGPQETCKHEARLAAVFNIPMISYVSIATVFSSVGDLFLTTFVSSKNRVSKERFFL